MKTVHLFPNEKISVRLVWLYSVLLSIACLFITLSPVFGQEEDNDENTKPGVKVRVNKEYDENGNVVRIDSVYTYYFTERYDDIEIDSLATESFFRGNRFHHYFNMPEGEFELPPLPDPLIPDIDFGFSFPPCDSSITYYPDMERFFHDRDTREYFSIPPVDMEEFMQKQQEMMKDLEQMLKQQQEMIRRYMEENKDKIESEMKNMKEKQKKYEEMKKEEQDLKHETDEI